MANLKDFMAENSQDFDDLIKKYSKETEDYQTYKIGFQEYDYNQFREFERRNEEVERKQQEAQRRAEERIRRHEERMLEAERRARRQAEQYARPVQPEHMFNYQDFLSSFGHKSQRELAIERLAVKFCFLRSKIFAIQTSVAMGNLSLALGYLNKSNVLTKVFEAIMKEAKSKGFSKEDISVAIMKLSAQNTEANLQDIFIKHFLGAVAINVFKKNPNIIKDTKRPSERKKTSPNYLDFEDIFEDNDLTSFERVRRMIEEMTERERGGQIVHRNWLVQDYPNLVQYQHPTVPIVSRGDGKTSGMIETLRNLMSNK